jgi:hypothetical protein
LRASSWRRAEYRRPRRACEAWFFDHRLVFSDVAPDLDDLAPDGVHLSPDFADAYQDIRDLMAGIRNLPPDVPDLLANLTDQFADVFDLRPDIGASPHPFSHLPLDIRDLLLRIADVLSDVPDLFFPFRDLLRTPPDLPPDIADQQESVIAHLAKLDIFVPRAPLPNIVLHPSTRPADRKASSRPRCVRAWRHGLQAGNTEVLMADAFEPVAVGALSIDCSFLASFAVDLPPGARRGLRVAQEGFGDVVNEIAANQAKHGEEAGITKADLDTFTTANERIAQIDAFLPAARKLVELLEETRAALDDQRQRQISAIADAVEGRAKAHKSGHLLAKYEKTRAYRSAVGIKAAKTRRRNATAQEDPAAVSAAPAE